MENNLENVNQVYVIAPGVRYASHVIPELNAKGVRTFNLARNVQFVSSHRQLLGLSAVGSLIVVIAPYQTLLTYGWEECERITDEIKRKTAGGEGLVLYDFEAFELLCVMTSEMKELTMRLERLDREFEQRKNKYVGI